MKPQPTPALLLFNTHTTHSYNTTRVRHTGTITATGDFVFDANPTATALSDSKQYRWCCCLLRHCWCHLALPCRSGPTTGCLDSQATSVGVSSSDVVVAEVAAGCGTGGGHAKAVAIAPTVLTSASAFCLLRPAALDLIASDSICSPSVAHTQASTEVQDCQQGCAEVVAANANVNAVAVCGCQHHYDYHYHYHFHFHLLSKSQSQWRCHWTSSK